MDKNDLFAPPTKEELQDDIFAPPSEAELKDGEDSSFPGEGLLRGTLQALPTAGALAGGAIGFASPVPGGTIVGSGLGAAGGKALQNWGESLLGDEKTYKQAVLDPVVAGAEGAAAEMGGQVLAKGISKVAGATTDKFGRYLKLAGEDFAENATGATAAQSEKFRDGTGRYLLDNKIVSFGDNAEDVARKAGEAINRAEGRINSSLQKLENQGVTVSQDDIVSSLQSKISDLSKDPSQADVVRKLNTMIDDIINTGESNVSILSAEQAKRGFNRTAGNWQDPEKGQAGKAAYRAYRDAVEGSAIAANPQVAEVFKGAKQDFGTLVPIVNAAERRAAQLNQSPIGGLLDVAGTAAGGTVGGIPGAVVGGMSRRIIAPRISSSMASALDSAGNALLARPQVAQMPSMSRVPLQTVASSYAPQFESQGMQSLPRAADSSPSGQQAPFVDQRLPMPESNIERAKRINMQRKLQRQSMSGI